MTGARASKRVILKRICCVCISIQTGTRANALFTLKKTCNIHVSAIVRRITSTGCVAFKCFNNAIALKSPFCTWNNNNRWQNWHVSQLQLNIKRFVCALHVCIAFFLSLSIFCCCRCFFLPVFFLSVVHACVFCVLIWNFRLHVAEIKERKTDMYQQRCIQSHQQYFSWKCGKRNSDWHISNGNAFTLHPMAIFLSSSQNTIQSKFMRFMRKDQST